MISASLDDSHALSVVAPAWAVAILVLFAGCLVPAPGVAQVWTPLGPEGGWVLLIDFDPVDANVVYAVIDPDFGFLDFTERGRLFRSLDGGERWVHLQGREAPVGVESLLVVPDETAGVDPGTLFVGVHGAVLRSDDRGATWTRTDLGQDPSKAVSVLALVPSTGTLYAVVRQIGVFRSADGGTTWSPHGHGLDATMVFSLSVDPFDTNVLYAGTVDGVYRSRDAGETWLLLGGGLEELEVAFVADVLPSPDAPGTVYAATYSDGLFRSTDYGDHWSAANADLPPGLELVDIAFDPRSPSTIYVVSQDVGLYRSTDAGTSWAPLREGVTIDLGRRLAISPTDSNVLYYGTASGLFKSEDAGAHFEAHNSGLGGLDMRALVISRESPDRITAASFGGGVWVSADDGETFTPRNAGLGEGVFIVDLVSPTQDPLTLYAADIDEGLLKSTNGGLEWTEANDGLPGEYESDWRPSNLLIDPNVPSRLYLATTEGVFRSGDSAASWEPANNGLEDTGPLGSPLLAIDPSSPSTLFVHTFSGLFRSMDRGTTWTAVGQPLGLNHLVVPAGAPSTLYAATSGRGLQRSLDSGASFERIDGGLRATVFSVAVDPHDSSTIYAGAASSVLRSVDGGASWTVLDAGLEEAGNVWSLVVDPDDLTVFAATERGIFRLDEEGGVPPPGGSCASDATTLCLDGAAGDRRFRITMRYDTGDGTEGAADVTPLDEVGVTHGGLFSFFDRRNPETLTKVLDGCAVNGHFWFFAAPATDVGFTITVEDTVTKRTRAYGNDPGMKASVVTDTEAFAICD